MKKKLVLRGLALVVAAGVSTLLVVDASLTSGCSKPDGAVRDPASSPLPTASSDPRVEPAVTASAPVNGAASASATPGQPSPPPSISQTATPTSSPPPHFGGSKSGAVFRPHQPSQQAPAQQAPQTAPNAPPHANGSGNAR